MSDAVVRVVSLAQTRRLRQAVLRPRESREELARYEPPDGFAVGVFDGGEPVAVGIVGREGEPGAWRVRGMATAPAARGRGLGAAVLAELVGYACARGARRIWCHARTPARSLYERAGFRAVSDEFELPDIGPHLVMELRPGPGGESVGRTTDPRVDAYIDGLADWQQVICREVRDLAHRADPEVVETIKRTNRPYFVLQGNVCALLAAKDHVNVFLYDGAIVPDPEGIITGGQDNKTARTVAVSRGETINATALTAMLRHIIANNRAGGWRKLKREAAAGDAGADA